MSEEIKITEERNKYKIVNFINKKYSLPEDILLYIELLTLTNDVRMSLNKEFYNILKNEEVGCIGDDQIRPEIDRQTKRFITKLLENDIYDRTITDYLNKNKGFELISKTNDDALLQMRKLFIQEVDEYQAGVEDALHKRDASITGMGFSIWSSSFVNHAIYAAMEASSVNKQEAAANKEYLREISELHQSITNKHEGAKKKYIDNVYIPSMEAAITIFAFELLDNYISDLIKNGKMSRETLKYINIDRSNDLLKNLELSSNKEEIMYKAFEACPYNLQVYGEVLRYGFLDYDTYQTAQYFKQGNNILISLVRNLGEVEYPAEFRINYDVAEKVAEFTKSDVISVLQAKTKEYANAVVKSYERIAQMLAQEDVAFEIMSELKDADILAGDAISKQKACAYVNEIVPQNVWNELIDKCGFIDLLDRIKIKASGRESASTKKEIDAFLEQNLYNLFEKARKVLVVQISERRKCEEQQKILETERAKKRKKNIVISSIISIIMIIMGVVISSKISYNSKISMIDQYIANGQYEHAFDSVNNSNLSDDVKQEYRDLLTPLMQTQIKNISKKDQVINVDGLSICLNDNTISYLDENDKVKVQYKGRGKIFDDIMYSNGYIIFVEAFDSWGYDANYINIDTGEVSNIDNFDEFDGFVKLVDGNIFINAVNSDDMYLIFDAYELITKTITDFSAIEGELSIVYNSDY